MTVHVHCPRCGCNFQRPDSSLNSTLPCPDCGQGLRVGNAQTEHARRTDGWKFYDMVKNEMSLFERYVLYRHEINAIKASLLPGNQELILEFLHGSGGILDASGKHMPNIDRLTLLVVTPSRMLYAVGRLATEIPFQDITNIAWQGEELHLILRDDEGIGPKIGYSGMWVRPDGQWAAAQKAALQFSLRDQMGNQEGQPRAAQPNKQSDEVTSPLESPSPFDEAAFLRRTNEEGAAWH
jgi:hypothetical protein